MLQNKRNQKQKIMANNFFQFHERRREERGEEKQEKESRVGEIQN